MDEQNVYVQWNISYPKKELGSLTCSNKDKLLKALYSGKYTRHNRKNIAQYHLYELSRRKKIVEKESGLEISRDRGWGGEGGGKDILLNEDRVSVYGDEKS